MRTGTMRWTLMMAFRQALGRRRAAALALMAGVTWMASGGCDAGAERRQGNPGLVEATPADATGASGGTEAPDAGSVINTGPGEAGGEGAAPVSEGSGGGELTSPTDGPGQDTGAGGGTTPAAFEECASESALAEERIRPVDIIWVIDSSGSMDGEARIVQENMNGFVANISSSGIDDYHVVVITEEGWVVVPAPLGNDPARFRFVNESVGSNDPLKDTLERLPDYQDFLREDAQTHVVVVTDDNENDLQGVQFVSRFEQSLGRPVTVHAIASDEGICIVGQCTPCVGVNGAGAAVGTEHFEAASVSGGLQFSICTEDWSALFSELATVVSVALPLPCVFSVPSAEAGETVNPDKVNVVFTEVDSDDGAALPRVTSEDACAAQGWYYDDPSSPAEIRLCAESCSAVEASLGGRVDIALGCDTILY